VAVEEVAGVGGRRRRAERLRHHAGPVVNVLIVTYYFQQFCKKIKSEHNGQFLA
jgi:hypothetical protein